MAMVTIKDVARQANVSISTVSRVMNNNYPVSKEAREKVVKVIKESGFSINNNARSLKSKKSRLIALAIPGIAHVTFMEMAKGLQDVVEKNDCNLVVVDTNESEEREKKVLNSLMERRVEGIVIASSAKEPSMIKKLIESGIKVVVVDRLVNGLENVSSVMWENYQTTVEVVDYLIGMGHKKIATICAANEFNVGHERMKGYFDALEKNNVVVPEFYHDNKNRTIDEAYLSVKKVLQSDNPPTVLICMSYFATRGALKATAELNLKIPEDISVVCFGKFDLNDYYIPKITTVEQDLILMGRRAGELLFESLDKNVIAQNVIIKSKIIDRNSVKKLN